MIHKNCVVDVRALVACVFLRSTFHSTGLENRNVLGNFFLMVSKSSMRVNI